MPKLSKRVKNIRERLGQVGQNVEKKVYSLTDAITLLKECAKTKFVESVDVSVNLGVDPRKSEQAVRGASVLPHGTGRSVKVAVFTQGANAEAAKAAGAEYVGMAELAESIQAGNMDFDVVIATPDAMGIVGKLGPLLGPRGLMPNPKVGTVTTDVTTAIVNAKGGQVRFKTDKAGIVHCTFGKISFDLEALKENLHVLMADLKRLKPTTSKGIYFKRVTVTTTMGPGLLVDVSEITS